MPDLTPLTAVLDQNGSESFRVRQRICALFLGQKGSFQAPELRDLCKETESYNSPNFTRNMKQDGHLYEGDRKSGWSLSEQGQNLAAEYFPAEAAEPVAAVAAPVAEPALDMSDVLNAIDEIPVEDEEPSLEPLEAPQEAIVPLDDSQATEAEEAPQEAEKPVFSYVPKVRARTMLADLYAKIQQDKKKGGK
jgi:hypothetical protein